MWSRFWTCAPVTARALVLSEKTVKTHVSSILAKLGSDAPAAGDNLRAFTGERISDGEADALACSSDDGDIARKLKIQRSPFLI
jgi:Bacterial regulatory proteins, luxR family